MVAGSVCHRFTMHTACRLFALFVFDGAAQRDVTRPFCDLTREQRVSGDAVLW